jgi:hypothetical protein
LTLAEFNHNSQVSKTTDFSPFFVTMGFHPRKGAEPRLELPTEDATKFATRMSKVREEAGAAMQAAQETMKRFYDAKRQADPDYKPGDKVYLPGANLVTHRPTKGFEARCYGPFTVVCKVGAISYELQLPDSWKVHLVFNTIFLRPWLPPVAAHQHHDDPPLPDVVDGVDLYEIAEVLKICLNKKRKHLQYPIRLEGYGPEDNTWEPLEHLGDSTECLEDFYEKYPAALGETAHRRKWVITGQDLWNKKRHQS